MNTSCHIPPLPNREGSIAFHYWDIFPIPGSYKFSYEENYNRFYNIFVPSLRIYNTVIIYEWGSIMPLYRKELANLFSTLPYLVGLTRLQTIQSLIFSGNVDFNLMNETIALFYKSPKQFFWLYPII